MKAGFCASRDAHASRFSLSRFALLTAPVMVAPLLLGSAGALAGAAPSCLPAPADLVAWWPGNGDAMDITGGNLATLTGAATYGPGESGQAFVFDGSLSGVQVANSASLELYNFTLETWIKKADAYRVNVASSNGEIAGYGRGGYGWGFYPYGRIYLSRIGFDGAESSYLINDTKWHHIAVTKNFATVSFYLDGQLANTVMYDAPFTFTTSFTIGALDTSMSYSFWGSIDELAVYKRALTAAEIASIYNVGSAGKCLVSGDPPVITRQPQSQAVAAGQSVTFSVVCQSIEPLTYAWTRNGTPIAGANAGCPKPCPWIKVSIESASKIHGVPY
jgi:hypothetical protein